MKYFIENEIGKIILTYQAKKNLDIPIATYVQN